MRITFIAGNWKMHKTVEEAVSLAKAHVEVFRNENKKIMIAPPYTALSDVGNVVKGSNIKMGAQNMAREEKGAHTGEISPLMLKDVGVEIVILGHSERRHVYGEQDELINAKVRLALQHNLEVILCVGEKISEREAGNAESVVERQVKSGLASVSSSEMKKITIAYEPVWAIGTGKTATPQDADAMHLAIRKIITQLYDRDIADRLVIQYGGSVKPGNIRELIAMENIDGALVGGASLTMETFAPIVQYDS
ncbi:MAG: triose-phosphate isomerase [Spirochaetales bacterium]|nr:triose-phosphate isomerase [Spirochaetales bacterium]